MKKKHPEHVNLERWLVSYADFITLLFAFFVIMYAMSQADKAKFKKLSEGLNKAFTSHGAGMIDIGSGSGGNTINSLENIASERGSPMNLPFGRSNAISESDTEIQEILELLEESFSLEMGSTELSGKPDIHIDSQGVNVQLSVKDFFTPGSEKVRPELYFILDRFGRILNHSQRMIRLEGHTDSGETCPKRFFNDWEFSAARAAWIAQYWIKRFDFDAKRMSIAGYSHFRPLSQGPEPWNHAKNRRVEITILPQKMDSEE